jgi:hypothetical protein
VLAHTSSCGWPHADTILSGVVAFYAICWPILAAQRAAWDRAALNCMVARLKLTIGDQPGAVQIFMDTEHELLKMSKRTFMMPTVGGTPLERIEHFDPEIEKELFKSKDKTQWNNWCCTCCCACPVVCCILVVAVGWITSEQLNR